MKKNKWDDKEYRRSYHRKWYAKNKHRRTPEEKEKRKASKRATYRKYRERILEEARQDYKANKGEYSVSSKKYYEKNKERVCRKVKEYREANKDKVALRQRQYKIKRKDKLRDYFLKRAYGISLADYKQMLHSQNGTCANINCSNDGKEDKRGILFVDHCHKSGKVRALLCSRCNRTLGMHNDSPSLLRGLADYVEGHSA